jgi:hypothetical protein
MTDLEPPRPRTMDEDFEPPYEAHTSIFPADWPDYVMGMFAVQGALGSDLELLGGRLEAALKEAPSPLHVEEIAEVDAFGFLNAIRMAYWRSAEDYRAWRSNPAVAAVFSQELQGPVGLWHEVICAPSGHVDPAGFLPRHDWGVGRHLTQVLEKYHAYYGSMRDRIPHFRSPSIEGVDTPLSEQAQTQSWGRRLKVALPHNICFVRGIFGWRNARAEERETFLQEMLPVYHTGAMFLRDNPGETLCISARHGKVVDREPVSGLDLETLMWFTSIASLEQWVHHHETHAAIFNRAREIGMRFEFKLSLDFGHEVVVAPQGGVDAQYNNCHPKTGFLRFFPAQPMT